MDKIDQLKTALLRAWSIESSSKWTKENPANGQCGVTALVVHDLFGGEILKTELSDGWHYYNEIDGVAFDFTESQFQDKINYQHVVSNRVEAFSDTNDKQYTYLSKKVRSIFNNNK